MEAEERVAQLEAKNATLRAENQVLREQVAQLLDRLHDLEGRLAKDSHNSSKPPASDSPARKTASQRKPSGKKNGGQPGHAGHHLALAEAPDEIVRHRPSHCPQCQQELAGVVGELVERRQVYDLPPQRLVVQEHQVEQVRCPHCQSLARGIFPTQVKAPAQYGPRVRALGVFLHDYHLLPTERTCEVLADVWGCPVTEATLLSWGQEAATTVEPTVQQIADYLAASPLQHADETGVRLEGTLHWVHVNSTRFLTHLAWHAKRGRAALEAIGIWPRFTGRAMHDRWMSYDHYACQHSVCGAHLCRELTFLAEHDQELWATQMKELLLLMLTATQEWRARGAERVPKEERDEWVAQYFAVLARGFAAHSQAPPPAASPDISPRRRSKQSPAKNLLDALLWRAEQVLAFLDDLSIPFTNNQAERDLRMVKVQQKIAGTFRNAAGLTAFCRVRSYVSTMRKQGHAAFEALLAVFAGNPLPLAWGI